MMGAAPMIGRKKLLSSNAEELMHAPESKSLGFIDPSLGFIDPSDEAPPWEIEGKWAKDATNARRFVDFPEEWEVRWLNPRLVNQIGLRYWKAVPADHEGVKIKVPTMRAPDNTVRRFDHNGDFLAYMPKAWIASRDRMKVERVTRALGLDRKKAEDTQESINRGEYGPYVHVDHIRRPSNTQAEGSSMTD